MGKCQQLHLHARRLKDELKGVEKEIEMVKLILTGNPDNPDAKSKLAFLERKHADV